MSALAEVIQMDEKKRKPKALAVRNKKSYPKNRDTVRPFRLWDAKNKVQMQWRNYAYSWSAIKGAWAEIQWVKAGQSIEVFNTTNGQWIATFTRAPGGHFQRSVSPAFNVRFDPKRKRNGGG
jgi:hypothetical protein